MTASAPPAVAWPARPNEIPKEIFVREDIYRQELATIFRGPVWHMVGHVAELAVPGAFKTIIIGDQRLLIVHGNDGRVRVFLNACPHRGTQLETRSRGKVAEIECPYHRWVFNTEGALLGAPGIDRFPPSFCKDDAGLRELNSEQRHGLIFATFSEHAPPLDEFLGPAGEALRLALGGDERVTARLSKGRLSRQLERMQRQ